MDAKTKPWDRLKVEPKWPHSWFHDTQPEFDADLVGATIIRIGTPRKPLPEPFKAAPDGGGLIIDYRPAGATEVFRLVLPGWRAAGAAGTAIQKAPTDLG